MAVSAIAGPPAIGQEPRQLTSEGWTLTDRLPGVAERVCTARREGREANTTLVINNAGVPVLILGRGDWNHRGGEASASLSIDGSPPVTIRASPVGNLVIVLLSDQTVLARLQTARSLHWTLPFGGIHTTIAGFGAALDAVRSCHDAARAGS